MMKAFEYREYVSLGGGMGHVLAAETTLLVAIFNVALKMEP